MHLDASPPGCSQDLPHTVLGTQRERAGLSGSRQVRGTEHIEGCQPASSAGEAGLPPGEEIVGGRQAVGRQHGPRRRLQVSTTGGGVDGAAG